MASAEEQLKLLRAALMDSPDNVPLRQHVGELLLGLGDAAGAVEEFKQAIALKSEEAALYYGLARGHYQLGQDSAALDALNTLLSLVPNHAEGLALKSKVLLQLGEDQAAVEQFRQALIQDKSLAQSDLADSLKEKALTISPSDADESSVDIERPKITFDDVGGMEAVKEEIRLKIIYPLTHPEMYKAYGQKIGGGLLMYGPPGCGKTHLARATAGEIRARFITVAISDVLDMYVGNSERNLHDVFDQARQHAPCVLFFDEVDALASRRNDMLRSGARHVINQFLTELDGVKDANDGVLVLAATNAPWYIDSAFRRPGRFDRILFVQPPDESARVAVLRLLCKGKPVEDIDYRLIARKTKRFSGADLSAVVSRAVEKKLQAAMKSGVPTPLTTKDLLQSVKSVNPSTREWFETARNYATHANQDGTYDDILTYLNQGGR